MGNIPSRGASQHHQQQQPQQHHLLHHHHIRHHHSQQSASSSAPSSNAATVRGSPSSSVRRPAYRRNSLQSPVSVACSPPTAQEFSTTARGTRGGYEGTGSVAPSDFLSPSDYNSRYHTPPPFTPRRESIAETGSGGYNARPLRTKEELLEDAATLKLFPTPPSGQDKAIPTAANTSPFTPGVNPFAQSSVSSRQNSTPSSSLAEGIHRGRGSMESTAASMVEDEMPPEPDARAIPTLIQWPHPGSRVYITGTFCGWEKRYRLTRNPDDGIMSAVVNIPPGTHHVKFLVDGEMRTSPALPTAVDDTGILVNYLEVSADDMPPLNRGPSSDEHAHHADSYNQGPPSIAPDGGLRYTTEIPAYINEFTENYNEDDPRSGEYATEGAPPPPSLPMMLQRVILNTSNQMKDDASVLSIPNHAVLNHLATSSIRNSILAVSATTRYKKKYVTTILYKAASAQED